MHYQSMSGKQHLSFHNTKQFIGSVLEVILYLFFRFSMMIWLLFLVLMF